MKLFDGLGRQYSSFLYEYYYHDFIVVVQGDRIGAFVKQTLIYRFQNVLKEGDVFRISNFSVGANIGMYRTTSHQYKINFVLRTVLLRAADTVVPPMIHRFIDPKIVYDLGYKTEYLAGVYY